MVRPSKSRIWRACHPAATAAMEGSKRMKSLARGKKCRQFGSGPVTAPGAERTSLDIAIRRAASRAALNRPRQTYGGVGSVVLRTIAAPRSLSLAYAFETPWGPLTQACARSEDDLLGRALGAGRARNGGGVWRGEAHRGAQDDKDCYRGDPYSIGAEQREHAPQGNLGARACLFIPRVCLIAN